MPTMQYGKPIDIVNANRLYKLFIDIKKRANPGIELAVSGDAGATRLYCGKAGTNPADEDLAFFFDKEAIIQILNKLNDNEAHGIAILNGARDQADSRVGDSEVFSDSIGRPTVIVFPFKYTDASNPANSDVELLLTDGSEHPGTGRKRPPRRPPPPPPPPPTTMPDDEIPWVFEAVNIDK